MKKEGPVIGCHTANELNRCLDCGQLVALLFTSTWCEPCRAIAPVYIELAEKFPNVVFLTADANELKRVAIDCGVESLPTIIFLSDRRIVDRLVGADESKLWKKVKMVQCVWKKAAEEGEDGAVRMGKKLLPRPPGFGVAAPP